MKMSEQLLCSDLGMSYKAYFCLTCNVTLSGPLELAAVDKAMPTWKEGISFVDYSHVKLGVPMPIFT